MMNLGNDHVSKVMVGASTVYQDSGGWIPLELPAGVQGTVIFKDNHDGTASLIGHAILQTTEAYKVCPLLNPPEGYKFVSDSWVIGGISYHAIKAQSFIGDPGALVDATQYAEPVYGDGSVGFRVREYLGGYRDQSIFIALSELKSNASASSAGLLTTINIEKV